MNQKPLGLRIIDCDISDNGGAAISLPKGTTASIIGTRMFRNTGGGVVERDDNHELSDALGKLLTIIHDLNLDSNDTRELQSDISTIQNQLESPNPKKPIMEISLSSAKTILEMVIASAISQNSPAVYSVVMGALVAIKNSGFGV